MTPGGKATLGLHGGPRVAPVDCPCCGKKVDPLRAGHVAIFSEKFHYFCDRQCRETYLIQHPELVIEQPRTRTPEKVRPSDKKVLLPLSPLPTATERASKAAQSSENQSKTDEPSPNQSPDDINAEQDLADLFDADDVLAFGTAYASVKSEPSALLLVSATVAGVMALAIALVATSGAALVIRLVVAWIGVLLLVARFVITPREPGFAHPAAVGAPMVLAGTVAIWAIITGNSIASEAATLTALLVVSTSTSLQLVQQVYRGPAARIHSLEQSLQAPARRVTASGYEAVAASSLRPGEEVVIDTGEMVPTDVMISAGEATVLAWLGAKSATRRQAGQALVAGAQVLSGRLRATVSWSAHDRAWLRNTSDPFRAAHVASAVARQARMAVQQWAPIAGAIAALATFANGNDPAYVLLAATAAYGALAVASTGAMPSVHVLRSVLQCLDRGISYQNADGWDRAAQTTVAVFCARGTLLLGEPQVAEMVALHGDSTDQLLSYAAGAWALSDDPVGTAIRKAAQDRDITVDAVRSPVAITGLGVTAVTSTGETLCVGSRALMLRERISIAMIEQQIAQLEAMGRTVLMISLKGKLRWFVALQDGLRPGARSAVQYLLDAAIEPVLMSNDSRETCEAIARSLDIEHIRPELLPADRGPVIKGIAESGATVAVIGNAPGNVDALDNANVSVALQAAGSTLGDWTVGLATDDVRQAAWALVCAKRARTQARVSMVIGLVPGIAAALVISFGLLPPAYAPLAVLISSVAAYLHLRAVQPANTDAPQS